jgi:hypothetical protein
LWNTTFPGNITAVKVCPPEGASPAYTVGPYVSTWSSWTGQDVAGQWSGGYLWMQIWNPGDYAIEVDFAGGASPYQGFLTVAGGVDAASLTGVPTVNNTLPQATPGATVVVSGGIDPVSTLQMESQVLGGAPIAGDVNGLITALTIAYNANGQQPMNVIIDAHGHGNPGQVMIGPGAWFAPRGYLQGAANVEPAFTAAMVGKIRSLTFLSCCVGDDNGSSYYLPLVQQLAMDLYPPGPLMAGEPQPSPVTVNAYTGFISINGPSWFGFRAGYIAYAANGHWNTFTYSGP